MGLFGRLSFGRHLLIATGLLLGAVAVAVVQNWGTVTLMYDNMAAMNEGSQMAKEMRHPEDLLDYLSSHPEDASLVAYDVGARDKGIFFQAGVQRPVVKTTHLMLLAEYARQVETDQLDPDRGVPLDSLAVYAFPGTSLGGHKEALAHWRQQNEVRPDSTVALRHVVDAITKFGDQASADWFMTALGCSQLEALPERWGLGNSEAPLPGSGIYLSWSNHQLDETASAGSVDHYRSMSRTAYADTIYRLVRTLRRDSSFRQRERRRLRQRGSGLSVRDQRTLAQVTYPKGTAADYADLLARSLDGSLGSTAVTQFVQRQIETPVDSDSVTAPVQAVGTQVGALPGVISFVGYIRYEDSRPPRVVSLLLEGLPMGVFYHLMQTSLDKGFQLRLLSDHDFFRKVRDRLAKSSGQTRSALDAGSAAEE